MDHDVDMEDMSISTTSADQQRSHFNDEMNFASSDRLWPFRLAQDRSDADLIKGLYPDILLYLTEVASTVRPNTVIQPGLALGKKLVKEFNQDELNEWRAGVQKGIQEKDWSALLLHPKLQPSFWGKRQATDEDLGLAYNVPFVGQTNEVFIEFINKLDKEAAMNPMGSLYAKVISIIQSSGTGKSRMVTEAGRITFALAICLRHPEDPGYPRSDKAVYKYFRSLSTTKVFSRTASVGVACFLAAAHETMFDRLKMEHASGSEKRDLLLFWQNLMESQASRKMRDEFYAEVVAKAERFRQHQKFHLGDNEPGDNQRATDFLYDVQTYYEVHAQKAVKALTDFLRELGFTSFITYFDEATSLDGLFEVILRVLSMQPKTIPMWYVFMATKLTVRELAPRATNMSSLRLPKEMATLPPAYLSLGFDQIITTDHQAKDYTYNFLQSLEHVCKYGRPLWNALFSSVRNKDVVLFTACQKLTDGNHFNPKDRDHVLAVLSSRLCIDLVFANPETCQLADRSVSNHMGLLTGISSDRQALYTSSPSEPILALGAATILSNPPSLWPSVLETFGTVLCASGLVEKGLVGELGARLLLLIARDFAARKSTAPLRGDDLLKPILLLKFLDTLFDDNQEWSSNRSQFVKAFEGTYVNFTHWILTKDPLPEVPDRQLIENLWRRHAALQCCYNQESLDLLVPTCNIPVDRDEPFHHPRVSAAVIQVKFKNRGAPEAEDDLRPIGIVRDTSQPLPYLAILLELGVESNYQATGSKMWMKVTDSIPENELRALATDLLNAQKKLKELQNKGDKKEIAAQAVLVRAKRRRIEFCNRYSISVRGASPKVYGILNTAKIAQAFENLLGIISPSPYDEDDSIQHMKPLERLGPASAYTDWMVGSLSEDESC